MGGFGGGAIDGTIISGVTANITVSSSNECAGGLLGYTKKVTITNTNVIGNVFGTSCVAGFIAKAEGTDNITNCTYRGDLNGNTNIGGISAYLAEGSSCRFTSCFTRGKVTATGDYVGGIVGVSKGASIAGIESCSHLGDITGASYIGGILGANDFYPPTAPPKDEYKVYISTSSNSLGSIKKTSYSNCVDMVRSFTSFTISNCNVVGNIDGNCYVGGVVGYDISSYGYTKGFSSRTDYSPSYVEQRYITIYKNSELLKKIYGYSTSFNIEDYTLYEKKLNIINSFYSGYINGGIYVGGLVGYKNGGEIQNNYSYGTLNGTIYVGGVVGKTEGNTHYSNVFNTTSVQSNVSNISVVSTEPILGRICGSVETDYVTIGELGSSQSNRASTKTQVILNGVIQEVNDDLQNGQSTGPSALKTKANYQAWGWNFDTDWNIIDGESWPYKKYQAAPPSIESDLISQETTISGKSLSGGTVYLTYNGQEPVAIACEGEDWSVEMEPLQSGATVTIYAETNVLVPSYPVTYTVSPKGEGTETDPYQIYTAYDLQGISKRGYYKLMNDIDLSAWILRHNPTEGWKPIGITETPEMMHLDGDNHVIKGLWTNSTNTYNGLFANLSNGGSVKNLAIQVATGKKLQGGDFAGILAGYAVNLNVENCLVKGDVETANYAGGLIGYAKGGGINKCYSKGSVKATGENGYAGGIVAYCSTPVTDSYSTADVEAQECVAGLVGYSTSTIDRCYAQGNITGLRLGAGVVAQLSGSLATITNSAALNESITMTGDYASASRVLNGNINGSPDPDESNVALKTMVVTINGKVERKYDDEWEGTGNNLETLMQASVYEDMGWDFTNVWGIVEDETVPYLLNEIKLGDVNRDGQIDMTDAVSIVYYYLGEHPKVFVEETADINGDGRIDITDAIIIVYQYLGENGNGASARALLNKALDNEPQ